MQCLWLLSAHAIHRLHTYAESRCQPDADEQSYHDERAIYAQQSQLFLAADTSNGNALRKPATDVSALHAALHGTEFVPTESTGADAVCLVINSVSATQA